MNAHYQRMASKCVHNPVPSQRQSVSPLRTQQQASTPLKYHVKINLKPGFTQAVYNESPKTTEKSFVYQRQQSNKQLVQNVGATQRLTLVKSPSTSFSPFKKQQLPKQEINQQRYMPVQNVRISLQQQHVFKESNREINTQPMLSIAGSQRPFGKTYQSQQNVREDQENNDYYYNGPPVKFENLRQKENSNSETVLNETIDKLDYLERKITNIMQKNDQLRMLLKRTDSSKNIPESGNKSTAPQYSSFNQCVTSHTKTFTREDTIQSVNQFLVTPVERASSIYSKSSGQPAQQRAKSQVREKGSTQNSSDNLFNFFKCGRGVGKKIYPNGYMYEGEWLEGIREGLGTLLNPLGVIIYQGEWKADFFHGRGRLVNELPMKLTNINNFRNYEDVCECWRTYEGEFQDGQKQGLGVMSFGEWKYHGHFENDVFQGNGSIINEKDGKLMMKGYWENGIMKK